MLRKKRKYMAAGGILLCLTLAGCSFSSGSLQEESGENHSGVEAQELDETQGQQIVQEQSAGEGDGDVQSEADEGYKKGKRIEEQTFDVTLRPLGQVTFAAYEPDRSENPLADAVFLIEKGDEVLVRLPGNNEENIALESFDKVEAVSFTDYNNDGYDDIILIISYYFGAGPQVATTHSTVRYYNGTAEGDFIYQEQMSEDALLALAEITVQTAKDFISGRRVEEGNIREAGKSLEPWQQEYIRYLSNDSQAEAQKGYTMISMTDDGIPQLVEVGIDEATGCRIIHYADGEAHVTQLNRLYFTYIPGENLLCNAEGLMDYYYDLIYRIIDGKMTLIASGYYGAADNSQVQFDEEGNPIYRYEWNGTEMSKEEYQQELSAVYDETKAVSYDYSDLYTLDEIENAVSGYMN